MTVVVLHVHGVPFPQGSKSAFVRAGRAVLVEGTSSKARAGHTAWRQAVATAARDYLDAHPGTGMLEGPVRIAVAFRFATVPSDRYRHWHTTTPDLDKLCRSVCDAVVSAGMLRDDCTVARLVATKRYVRAGGETPGATIELESVLDDERAQRAARKAEALAARKVAS